MSDRDLLANPRSDSALARELRRLSSSQRRALSITDAALEIWDCVITCTRLALDENATQPWWQRIGAFLEGRFGDIEAINEEDVERITSEFTSLMAHKVPGLADDVKKEGFRKFIRRAVGESQYQRLESALREDAAVITVALRRATQGLMPFAVALDDLYGTLPEDQRLRLPTRPDLPNSTLSLMLMLDTSLDRLVDFSAPAILEEELPAPVTFATKAEITALIDELREVVSGRSRAKIKELSSTLSRKVQGARDALQYSADPVAQAANSLIELIDRLLRSAFTDAEVVAWVEKNYPRSGELTRLDNGVTKPTKRGQILCFVHAGGPVDQPSVIHEMAAAALVATRTQLQKLKHADLGTDEEVEQIRRLLAAVEGFLHLAIGIAWATVSDQQVDSLRAKLDARQ